MLSIQYETIPRPINAELLISDVIWDYVNALPDSTFLFRTNKTSEMKPKFFKLICGGSTYGMAHDELHISLPFRNKSITFNHNDPWAMFLHKVEESNNVIQQMFEALEIKINEDRMDSQQVS